MEPQPTLVTASLIAQIYDQVCYGNIPTPENVESLSRVWERVRRHEPHRNYYDWQLAYIRASL